MIFDDPWETEGFWRRYDDELKDKSVLLEKIKRSEK